MKRRDLIRFLESQGCELLRHGKKHDLYINTKSGERQPIPRHTEIKESLVRIILRDLGLETRGEKE